MKNTLMVLMLLTSTSVFAGGMCIVDMRTVFSSSDKIKAVEAKYSAELIQAAANGGTQDAGIHQSRIIERQAVEAEIRSKVDEYVKTLGYDSMVDIAKLGNQANVLKVLDPNGDLTSKIVEKVNTEWFPNPTPAKK